MTELLASLALFREFYDNSPKSDLIQILAEFIIGAIIEEGSYSLRSPEITQLVNKKFGFTIPESVIRSALKHKTLKEYVVYNASNGFYNFDNKINEKYKSLERDLSEHQMSFENIIYDLCNFAEHQAKKTFSESDRLTLKTEFENYLLDDGWKGQYTDIISCYLIKNEDKPFIEQCNSIKEGLVIYNGICYSPSVTIVPTWKAKLKIYLSAECLFSLQGYNGTLQNEIMNDFWKLVCDINARDRRIELAYLDLTKGVIDKFFTAAEEIKRYNQIYDPSKEAMKNILKGVSSPSDIVRKKTFFYSELERKRIEHCIVDLGDSQNYYEGMSFIEEIVNQCKEKSFHIEREREDIFLYLSMLSKINYLRNGYNSESLETCRHILMAENHFILYLAYHKKVMDKDGIPLAQNIDDIITYFWLKLQKGFAGSHTPKTFSVVAKAKIILAGHIANSVSNSFNELRDKFRNGKLTEKDALQEYTEIKKLTCVPEAITKETVGEKIELLQNDSLLEQIERESAHKEYLLAEAQENARKGNEELQKTHQENEQIIRECDDLRLQLQISQKEQAQSQEIIRNQRVLSHKLRYTTLCARKLRAADNKIICSMILKVIPLFILISINILMLPVFNYLFSKDHWICFIIVAIILVAVDIFIYVWRQFIFQTKESARAIRLFFRKLFCRKKYSYDIEKKVFASFKNKLMARDKFCDF